MNVGAFFDPDLRLRNGMIAGTAFAGTLTYLTINQSERVSAAVDQMGFFLGMEPSRYLSVELPTIAQLMSKSIIHYLPGTFDLISGNLISWTAVLVALARTMDRETFSVILPALGESVSASFKMFLVANLINSFCFLFYPEDKRNDSLQERQDFLLYWSTLALTFHIIINLYNRSAKAREEPIATEKFNWVIPMINSCMVTLPVTIYVHEFGHLCAMKLLVKYGKERIVIDTPLSWAASGMGWWDMIVGYIWQNHHFSPLGKSIGTDFSRFLITAAGPAFQLIAATCVFKHSLKMPQTEYKRTLLISSVCAINHLVNYSYSSHPNSDFIKIQNYTGLSPVIARIAITAIPLLTAYVHQVKEMQERNMIVPTATLILLNTSLNTAIYRQL